MKITQVLNWISKLKEAEKETSGLTFQQIKFVREELDKFLNELDVKISNK